MQDDLVGIELRPTVNEPLEFIPEGETVAQRATLGQTGGEEQGEGQDQYKDYFSRKGPPVLK